MNLSRKRKSKLYQRDCCSNMGETTEAKDLTDLITGVVIPLVVVCLLTRYCLFRKTEIQINHTQLQTRWPYSESNGYHKVGFCFKCKKQTRLPHHCDGCGGSGNRTRHFIILHWVEDNKVVDYVCTRCGHLALYEHHCAYCNTNQTEIIPIK